MSRRRRIRIKYRSTVGILCMAVGTGMLIIIILPGWGFLLAATLIIIGFWLLLFS